MLNGHRYRYAHRQPIPAWAHTLISGIIFAAGIVFGVALIARLLEYAVATIMGLPLIK